VLLALAAIPADLEVVLVIGRCRRGKVAEIRREVESQRRICSKARLSDRQGVLEADEVARAVAATAAPRAESARDRGESGGVGELCEGRGIVEGNRKHPVTPPFRIR